MLTCQKNIAIERFNVDLLHIRKTRTSRDDAVDLLGRLETVLRGLKA